MGWNLLLEGLGKPPPPPLPREHLGILPYLKSIRTKSWGDSGFFPWLLFCGSWTSPPLSRLTSPSLSLDVIYILPKEAAKYAWSPPSTLHAFKWLLPLSDIEEHLNATPTRSLSPYGPIKPMPCPLPWTGKAWRPPQGSCALLWFLRLIALWSTLRAPWRQRLWSTSLFFPGATQQSRASRGEILAVCVEMCLCA